MIDKGKPNSRSFLAISTAFSALPSALPFASPSALPLACPSMSIGVE